MGCTYVFTTMYFGQGQMQHSIEYSQVTRWEQHSVAPRGPREASSALGGLRVKTCLPLNAWQKHLRNCNAFIQQAEKLLHGSLAPPRGILLCILRIPKFCSLQIPRERGQTAGVITELNPSNSNDGTEGFLQILTITKFRPSGAFLQCLKVVELIWKPLY